MTSLDLIRAAETRLRGVIRRTPLLTSPFLDDIAGRRIWVKAECLQHTGSFKARGGYAAVSALDPQTRARGVLAYSSGNHAQGVAWAAKLHGVPSVIVMPSNAPKLKIENTKALGAEVVLYDRATESREAVGEALATARDLTLIRPYDEPQVIAGQGTCGLELAAQMQTTGVEKADVLVCCGGGGLSSGMALALAGTAPGFRVRPVEPVGFDDVKRSLATGEIQRNDVPEGSICDAIVTPAPGAITFPLMRDLCGPGLAVSDDEVLQAVALAFLRLKLVVEPGGAVALAAALFRGAEVEGEDVVVVCTGGNIDPQIFRRALAGLDG